ncbi:phosphatase PAP2 family protein [Kitasatospora sp. NPDC101447]|uniref:phosphatase PAP2 family protein n=1 Tax=Kitasatospora sp. NPDC101447 TaxID=3364102 RepID=UPI00380E96E8
MSGRLVSAASRVWLGVVASVAAVVVTVGGVRYAGAGGPGVVDARVQSAVYGVGQPWRGVALVLDFLGEPVGSTLLVVAVVIGCLLGRRPRGAVLVVAGVGLTVGTATVLKHVVGRTIHGDGNLSYPSGHTAFFTALALAVALAAPRHRGPLVLGGAAVAAGAAMGWAQVALGAHYPTDVLGGWCTALVVVPVTAWLVDRTADRAARA